MFICNEVQLCWEPTEHLTLVYNQDIYSSLAAGVGFAGMHGVLMYGTLISNSAGAGTLFADNCPQFSTFVVSSWLAAGFGILHMVNQSANWASRIVIFFACYPKFFVYMLNIFFT